MSIQKSTEDSPDEDRLETTVAIEYEETTNQTRGNYDDVAKAWLRGIYPDSARSGESPGTIYCSDYFAYQHDDDHHTGIIEWHWETEAVRTESGLVICNTNFTGTGGLFGSSHANRVLRVARKLERTDDINVTTHSCDLSFIEDALDELTQGESRFSTSIPDKYDLTKITDVQSDANGELYTFACGDQLYVGYDETAHIGNETFAFLIDGAEDPVPNPERATDLLEPELVREARADGADVPRQGEYFFIPEEGHRGTIQKPGVGEHPYGPSPLDSHVPRDWATVCDDDIFVERFCSHEEVTFTGDERPETPQEVLEFLHFGEVHYESTFDIEQVPELANGICVRGTVRHDENEHYVTTLDEWHIAVTHDRDVVTIDDTSVGVTHD